MVEIREAVGLVNSINAMSKCYGKKCSHESLVKAVKAGHTSLLEHVQVTIDIVCSQKVLAQITRHRHFSFTVQSTRGSNILDNGFFSDFKNISVNDITSIKNAYGSASMQFVNLVNKGVPLEVASYVLPLGTKVKLTVTGNLRTWIEYLKKRLCKRASEEHLELAKQIYSKLNAFYPSIVTTDIIGVCKNCQEVSCDFTSHVAKPKNPIVKELHG